MNLVLDSTMKALEQVKRFTKQGVEYWFGRDLQIILAYTSWENFEGVIEKAIMACKGTGFDPRDHFHAIMKVIESGKGAKLKRKDYHLTRYACYLITMNGDSNKSEVATAQTYFAIQTRKQELQDQLTNTEYRYYHRERVKNENYKLAGIAQKAGVRKQKFPSFQDAGYRGLYTMTLAKIKEAKGLLVEDNLLDRIGRTELAANEFRITQTQDKIIRDNIQGEENAINTHYAIGKMVRDTISKIGGTMPEKLPAEPPIKGLSSDRKKEIRKLLPK